MKVLFATDGSIYSEAALNSIISRPWSEDTEFLVVHVVQAIVCTYMGFNYGYAEALAELDDREKRVSQKIVDQTVSILKEKFPKLKIEGRRVQGHIVDGIVEAAKEFDAELIVVGSHGLTGLTKFFLGSVAEAVLDRAPCSVEIIRVDFEKEAKERHQKRTQIRDQKSKEKQAAAG